MLTFFFNDVETVFPFFSFLNIEKSNNSSHDAEDYSCEPPNFDHKYYYGEFHMKECLLGKKYDFACTTSD